MNVMSQLRSITSKSSYVRDRSLLLSWISHDTETNPILFLSLLRTRRVGIRSSLRLFLLQTDENKFFTFRSSLDLHYQKFIHMILSKWQKKILFFSNYERMFFCIQKFKFLYFAFLNFYFSFCGQVRNKKIFTSTFLFIIFLY